MKKWIVTLIILLSATAPARELRGIARNLSGDKELYSEYHIVTLNDQGLNQKIETKYYKPDGRLFATMVSDFSKNYKIPLVTFEDFRFQKKEELFLDSKEARVVFRTSVGQRAPQEKKYKIKEDMVAGQGFDNFVKMNFETLARKNVSFSFGVLSEMDFFSFDGYRKPEIANGIVKFGIRLKSLFLRLFSSELLLEYDSKTKQLLTYKGLSNLLSDEGKSQEVLIKYEVVKP